MLCLFPLLYYNILHVFGKKNIVQELWDKHACGWNRTIALVLTTHFQIRRKCYTLVWPSLSQYSVWKDTGLRSERSEIPSSRIDHFICHCISQASFFLVIFIGIQFIYVVLVSTVQQSELATCTHISTLLYIPLPYGSFQSIEKSSPSYTAGPYQLSTLTYSSMYMSIPISHPPTAQPQVCPPHLWLYLCSANKFQSDFFSH